MYIFLCCPNPTAVPGESVASLLPEEAHTVLCSRQHRTLHFHVKVQLAVQPLGITVSELALQYWADVVINPSDKTGTVTVWCKGLCITA